MIKTRLCIMSVGVRFFYRMVVFAVIAAVFGSEIIGQSADRKIKISNVSLNKDIVNITGDLEGKPASLMCLKTTRECTVPEQRTYLVVQVSPEMSIYNDCLNIYLYSYSDKGDRGSKIGLYCLLSPDLYSAP